MEKTIAEGELLPGDVLLSLGKGKLSECISQADGGHHSHAAIWTGSGLVEATLSSGVIEELSLAACIKQHPHRYIDVFRHKNGGGARVVERARAYKTHLYSRGDLELVAVLLVSSSYLPLPAWQLAYLMTAEAIEQLLGLDKPKDQERVTCTEIVARAFFEAGVPIHVHPEPGHHVDPSLLWAAVEELKNHPAVPPGTGPSVAEARALLELIWRSYLQLMGLAPIPPGESLRWRDPGEPPWLTAGGDWSANFVTPHNLAASKDLEFMGRLYTAPDEPQSKL